jgi:hypothetical protein
MDCCSYDFTDAMSLSQIGGNVEILPEEQKQKVIATEKWKEVILLFLILECLVLNSILSLTNQILQSFQ